VGDLFLLINWYEKRLELYSSDGELLSYVGRQGKGPEEFLSPNCFDRYENIIYVMDNGNDKIVIIELDEKNSELKYIDEFRVDRNPADICAISRDKCLVSVYGDVNNIRLYDNKGNLLNEYSIPEKERFKDMMDMLHSPGFMVNCGDEDVLLGSALGMKLYFCKFRHEDNSLIPIKERDTMFQLKYSDRIERKNGINVYGLGELYCANNNYYVSFDPDCRKFSESFFEIYSKSGDFLGNAYVKDNIAYNFAFSSDADTLWFMHPENDTTIYVAEREKQ
jgi:hypothetical protein